MSIIVDVYHCFAGQKTTKPDADVGYNLSPLTVQQCRTLRCLKAYYPPNSRQTVKWPNKRNYTKGHKSKQWGFGSPVASLRRRYRCVQKISWSFPFLFLCVLCVFNDEQGFAFLTVEQNRFHRKVRKGVRKGRKEDNVITKRHPLTAPADKKFTEPGAETPVLPHRALFVLCFFFPPTLSFGHTRYGGDRCLKVWNSCKRAGVDVGCPV